MTNLAWIGSVEEEQSKSIWKDLKSVKNMWEKSLFKNSVWISIGQKLDSIDQKSISINPASIELGRFKPKF